MNLFSLKLRPRQAWLVLLAAAMHTALASPGAHGPNGEHLDAPGQAQVAGGNVPRFETKSETFELVGRLQGGELSMLINRFETNEPVLEAKVEIESGDLKAPAKFHADMGDYAVDDAAMLKRLGEAGEHPIVVTVIAGKDTDLLDGTLLVRGAQAAGDDHGDQGHEHDRRWWFALGGVAALATAFMAGRFSGRATRHDGGVQ